jgi:hypothetical protein
MHKIVFQFYDYDIDFYFYKLEKPTCFFTSQQLSVFYNLIKSSEKV